MIYRCGIDIGSTTVKLVVLDKDGRIIYGQYKRHLAKTRQTLKELISGAIDALGDFDADIRITGSGAISLAKALDIRFVQ
ncbi:MAG: activator of (R)-2-hydroxyglutaryl-CoA dehydratase, partial [Clostridia bacterium]|nr:activator of (R)-2-hydroxyglutaryl-CoA dehydratase [Clostridia bacterium]